MIFYLAGGKLAPTQAEAKAIDPNFVQHDVPTDKPGLMAYINNLMQAASTQQHTETIIQNMVHMDKDVFDQALYDTATHGTGIMNMQAGGSAKYIPHSELRPGEDCIACRRTKEASQAMAGVIDVETVKKMIARIDNESSLWTIVALLEERLT